MRSGKGKTGSLFLHIIYKNIYNVVYTFCNVYIHFDLHIFCIYTFFEIMNIPCLPEKKTFATAGGIWGIKTCTHYFLYLYKIYLICCKYTNSCTIICTKNLKIYTSRYAIKWDPVSTSRWDYSRGRPPKPPELTKIR